MNTFFKKLATNLVFIALAVVIALLLFRSCTEPEIVEKVVTKHTRDTVYVTKEVKVPEYIPKWRTKVEYKEKEVPMEVDTTEILKDYFSEYVYDDTLNLDSLGYGILHDTISENKIKSRSIDWYLQIPVIYDSTEVTVYEGARRKLFVGGGLGATKGNVLNMQSVGVIYADKKNRMFGLHTGRISFNGEAQPFIQGSVYFKISLRRKE